MVTESKTQPIRIESTLSVVTASQTGKCRPKLIFVFDPRRNVFSDGKINSAGGGISEITAASVQVVGNIQRGVAKEELAAKIQISITKDQHAGTTQKSVLNNIVRAIKEQQSRLALEADSAEQKVIRINEGRNSNEVVRAVENGTVAITVVRGENGEERTDIEIDTSRRPLPACRGGLGSQRSEHQQL